MMHLTLVCRELSRVAARPVAGATVCRLTEAGEAPWIHELAHSLGAGPSGPAPRADGLVAELRSRPGRDVQAWVAWEADRDAGDHRPLGLVTLVQSSRGDNCRWSIGWLIVRPEARRRGVGRGLVATALAAAAAGGAGAGWAETDARWAAARAFWHNIGFEAV